VSASGHGKRPVRPCCQTGASLAECGIAPLQTLLYWLQTEAPRPDGGTGWKGMRLRPDVVGTEDGLAKYPYIRASRRIRALIRGCRSHGRRSSRGEEV
jgi:hypothetical protein